MDPNNTQNTPGMPEGQDYVKRRKRRRMKKSARRILVLLVAVVMMLSVAWVVTGMIQNWAERGPSSVATPASSYSLPPVASLPQQTGLPQVPAVNNSTWNFPAPLARDYDPAAMGGSDKRLYSLPENGRIDMSYFDTAVFVGDSLTQGLQLYSQGIPNAKYCAYKGVSPKQIYDGSMQQPLRGEKEVPMDALVAYNPDNVYVLLGTNAMVGMDNESLLGYYNDMLDVMKERLGPEVNIYVQSITPVLQGVDPRFSFDDIKYLNDMLARMAWEKGLYFVDLHEALAGDDGWLRTDYGATRDGYHMNPSGYAAWVEYLVTHTAYSPKHAHLYTEGSYAQLPPVQ